MKCQIDCNDVKCADVRKYLYDYVEEEMTAKQKAAVDAHLKDCARCCELVGGYKLSIKTARYSMKREEKIPDNFKDRLLESLDDSQE